LALAIVAAKLPGLMTSRCESNEYAAAMPENSPAVPLSTNFNSSAWLCSIVLSSCFLWSVIVQLPAHGKRRARSPLRSLFTGSAQARSKT
jgi:hypothetical protein